MPKVHSHSLPSSQRSGVRISDFCVLLWLSSVFRYCVLDWWILDCLLFSACDLDCDRNSGCYKRRAFHCWKQSQEEEGALLNQLQLERGDCFHQVNDRWTKELSCCGFISLSSYLHHHQLSCTKMMNIATTLHSTCANLTSLVIATIKQFALE